MLNAEKVISLHAEKVISLLLMQENGTLPSMRDA
jgi:hypothetical protein